MNAMIDLAVTFNLSRDCLRTHMRYVHLVTWPNLSMLVSTTQPVLICSRNREILTIVEGAVKAL